MKTITTTIDYCKITGIGFNDEKSTVIKDKEIDGSIVRCGLPAQRINIYVNYTLKDIDGNDVENSGSVYTAYEDEIEMTKSEIFEFLADKWMYYIAKTKYETAGYIVPGFEEADFIIK